MYRPNSQGVPNGLPANWCGPQAPIQPQKTPSHQLNNGVESSRDSSPVARLARGHIPASQLPPGRPVISPIGHNMGPNGVSATPQSSPRVSNFNTSTPILQTNDISSAAPPKEATVNQFAPPYSSAANLPQHYPLIGQQTNVLTPMPVYPQTGGNLPQSTNLLPVTNLPANMPPMRQFQPPSGNLPPSIGQHPPPALPQASGNLFQPSGNISGAKLNLNQQITERPLSSGPAKSLNEQSQYAQSQGQLGALPTASVTDTNQQRSAPSNQFTQQFNNLPPRQNKPTSTFDSNNVHQPQTDNRPPISQTFNNFPPNSPKRNMTPPVMTTSGQPSPNGSDSSQHMAPTGSDRPPITQTFSALPAHSSAPTTMVTSSGPPISQSFTLAQNVGPHKSGQPSPAHSDNGKQSFNKMPPISQSFNIPPFTGGPKPPMYPNTGSNLPPYSAPRPNLPPPTINTAPQQSMPPNFIRPQLFNVPPKASITPPVMAPGPASEPRTQQFLPPTSGAMPPPMATTPAMPPPMTTTPAMPPPMTTTPAMQPYSNLPQTVIAPKRQPSPANSDSSKTQTYNNFADVNRVPLQPFNNSGAMPPQLMNNQNYSRLPQPNPTPNLYNPAQPPRGPAPVQIPPPQIQPSAVSSIHAKRYPQPQYQNQPPHGNFQQPNYPAVTQQNALPQPALTQQYKQPAANYQQAPQAKYNQINYQQNVTQQMANMNVVNSGFNKAWGAENYDLLNCPNILPEEPVQPPKVHLGQEFLDNANCNSEIFRCTMTKVPESNSLLQKSRLPLGVLIHPFKDLNHLPVIQCTTIVRCRACRTYINPFIFFVDTKRWKCNLCYRVNELPEEFHYDPVSKSYGDPSRRPEIKSSTIEYIAPSEYMLRPPQPAVYLFLLDISRIAIESGYLHTVCEVLTTQLATLPGDGRTQIGFIAYNSTLHFFSLAEGLSQPHEMIVSEIDDVFLPCPDNLLVNLKEHMELITDLLTQLPTRYQNSYDSGSALGAALQAALKMMSSTGGRVSVFQTSLPMLGPGALTVREDPNQRAGKEAPHLNPATDFYKRLALDCSAHQIAVDLFILNSQYVDVASLSGVSRFSGGCMYHFPLFKASRIAQAESLEKCFRRYLTRKIGFEAVMRIRCTRGLAIHTFHGNFFVRSTDLLSLPNVNPDAGFGMQVSIEESLSDLQSVCFQAALLYTSSKGERRIRVHTLCLPIVTTLPEVLNSADQQCIVGFLAKMAVDRSLQTSLSDARDAFINAAIDILSSYKLSLNMGSSTGGLIAPNSLKLLPLYILALLKFTAFRTGQSTRLDDRVFAMCDMKTLPLAQLLQQIYPDLYPLHRLGEFENYVDSEGVIIPQLPRLQVTSRNIDSHGAYLLDVGQQMIIFVCQNITPNFLTHTLGVPSFNSISDQCYELPKLDIPDNQRLHAFINHLNDEKPYPAALLIMRENSPNRTLMFEHLIEDRLESALSYNEFLQHLKTQVK